MPGQTHFSNQFSGAIKAFHFYVSGMSNCLTDTSTVAYAIDNSYLTVQTDTVDATTRKFSLEAYFHSTNVSDIQEALGISFNKSRKS